MAGDSSSLSARAQEILRRADAQLEALRAPAPRLPEPPAPEELAPRDPSRPPEIQDLGALVDVVQAGVEAAATHLVALSQAVERIAAEIEEANEAHRRTLPPELEGHARLPEEAVVAAGQTPEAESAGEPEDAGTGGQAPQSRHADESAASGPGPEAPHDAAHDAARLVAIEMAVAGDTREGVGRRLREEFGIKNPRSILDDAFGPEPGPAGRTGYGT